MSEAPTSLVERPQNITSIAKAKTDSEKAQSYRGEVGPLLEQVASIITRARMDDGLIVGFNIAPDQYGRSRVMQIDVVKPL